MNTWRIKKKKHPHETAWGRETGDGLLIFPARCHESDNDNDYYDDGDNEHDDAEDDYHKRDDDRTIITVTVIAIIIIYIIRKR